MKTVRYVCTHCGRRFEDEEKDLLECPGCFWSSSVKREEDWRPDPVAGEQDKTTAGSPGGRSAFRLPAFSVSGKQVLLVLGLILCAAAVLFVFSRMKSREDLSAGGGLFPAKAKKNLRIEQPREVPSGLPAPDPGLTEAEKGILDGRIVLSAGRPLSDEEKQILERALPFGTGLVEKLPFQPLTLENFEAMLAEQERFYKMPLPRSYKSKLKKSFAENYLAGTAAFEAGEIAKARDAWVASLAFPIFANNVQKHRGVVLTMLRPFIQDTLSKIAALNNILVERQVRSQETEVSEGYARANALLKARDWPGALAALQKASAGLAALGTLDPGKLAPPPYPPAVGQVDEGIRATLAELLNLPPPAVADVDGLRSDILEKTVLAESLIPERLPRIQERYDAAAGKIRLGNYEQAGEQLEKEFFPLPMRRDLEEKLRIAKKTAKSGLDSADHKR